MEWTHQCLITKAGGGNYWEEEGLEFKNVLIQKNAFGHLVYIRYENEIIEVLFLSENSASLLQALDQSIIWFVKAVYTCLVFIMFN